MKKLFYSILLIFFLSLSHIVLADGCFQPVASQKIPDIPLQRAVIVYKDKTEKLIVESSLSGKGESFAWIMPVPGKPIEVKEVSPGFIKTLSNSTGPTIIQPYLDRENFTMVFIITVFITIWLLFLLTNNPGLIKSIISLISMIFFGLFIFFTFSYFTKTAGINSALNSVEGVNVEENMKTEHYEIFILDAQTSNALNEWLKANSFKELSDKGKAISEDYIKNKWHFIAVKIKSKNETLTVPSPLSITFPTENPVYPMKLTSLPGSKMYIELFVISDKEALIDKLALDFCETYELKCFEKRKENEFGYMNKGEFLNYNDSLVTYYNTGSLQAFVGCHLKHKFLPNKNPYVSIGYPGASDYMWDGCVLTRFSGILKPGDMKDDLNINFKPPSFFRREVYSKDAVSDLAIYYALILWNIIIPAGVFLFYIPSLNNKGRKFMFFRFIIPAFLLSVLVYSLTYLSFHPRVDTKLDSRDGYMIRMKNLISIPYECMEETNKFKDLSLGDIKEWFKKNLKNYNPGNPVTGGDFFYEDSPGNYTIVENNGKIIFRTYNPEGFPVDIDLEVEKSR